MLVIVTVTLAYSQPQQHVINMELKFFLTLSNKLVSVNDLYKAKLGYRAGRPYPVVYKNPRAVKLSNEMRDQMRALIIQPELLDWLKKTKQFTLYLHAVFKTGMNSRDASNIVKLAEDELVKYIKYDLGVDDYDDSLHIKVISEKSVLPKAAHEFLGVCLGDYVQNVRFDSINRPEKIWVSKDQILTFPPLPKRKKKGEKYYEIVGKDDADTLVYVIEDEKDLDRLSTISVIQDVESVNTLRKYNFIYIAVLNNSIPGISEFIDTINKYSYSGIKAECLNSKDEIINWIKSF